MINLTRQPSKADCSHESADQSPGTAGYGLERSLCSQCGHILLKHTETSPPGALFKNRKDGGLFVGTRPEGEPA